MGDAGRKLGPPAGVAAAAFFDVLGVSPALGRPFVSSEDEPGRDRVVVIGDSVWKQRFGGDPRIVGSQIRLDGDAYTIVGIAPPRFEFPVGVELWAPLVLTSTRTADRSGRSLTVMGRLKPDTAASCGS